MSALTDMMEAPGGAVLSVGQLLRRRREERGDSLQTISGETRISQRYLSAIEDGALGTLPGLTYAVGFVRTYAGYLGLPSDDVVAQFRAEAAHHAPAPRTSVMQPLDERQLPSRGLVLIALAGLALTIGGVTAARNGWFDRLNWQGLSGVVDAYLSGDKSSTQPAAPSPAASAVVSQPPAPGEASAPAVPGAADAGQSPGPTPAVDGAPAAAQATSAPETAIPSAGPVTVTAREDAWVKIYDAITGKTVRMGVMKAGEVYAVPADRRLLLWTGRAGALELRVADAVLPSLGGPAELVRNVPLDAARLSARFASRPTPGAQQSPAN